MYIDWMSRFATSMAAICACAAIADCLSGEEGMQSGVKFVCGTYAALAVIQFAAESVQDFF